MKLQTPFVFIGILILLALIIAAGVLFFRETPGGPDEGAGGRADFFSSLFPFGEGLFGERGTPGGEARDAAEDAREVPPLREVSGNPTSGGFFTDTGTIVFLESETGHVFETAPDTYASERISNATMPGIQEAFWLSEDSFIARTLAPDETIINVIVTLTDDEARPVTVRPLHDFNRVAVSPGGASALTVTETGSGSRIEIVELSKPQSPRTLLSSPLNSWLPKTGGSSLFLQSAPSTQATGFLYEIRGQELIKVVGGHFGLMTNVSPSGRYVLYSDSGFTLSLLDRNSNTVYEAPVRTIATKCAWLTEEPLLFCGVPEVSSEGTVDSWLMGTTTLEDRAWLIDPVHSLSQFVADLSDNNGARIDVIEPSVNADNTYALFINKNNGSLWSLSFSP